VDNLWITLPGLTVTVKLSTIHPQVIHRLSTGKYVKFIGILRIRNFVMGLDLRWASGALALSAIDLSTEIG
jgi:hypothetical protein